MYRKDPERRFAMPYYNRLRPKQQTEGISTEDRRRTIAGIQRLREQKFLKVPTRTLKDTLLLATWNIRDFGNEDKRAKGDGQNQPGERLEESYYYIAEVISAFDIVAIQEINTLEALERVMDILGPSWEHLTTDIKPDDSGNHERMTFVYDKRKIWFKHIAGQVVIGDEKQTGDEKQFVRTPYYAAFQSGWFRFSLCTVHILYGDYEDTTERIAEINKIAGFLQERVDRTGENMILLGDFNILGRDDHTFQPLKDHGWTVPPDFKTNVAKSRSFDQIAFKIRPGELQPGSSDPNAGAFDFFESVFRQEDWKTYYEVAKATGRPMESWDKTLEWPENERLLTREEYFGQWRTWQMSDHMPLWVELKIDFTDEYLQRLAEMP
jgi:endonuclease/exonuclease/phosphatase family metal-dependent hydrolase